MAHVALSVGGIYLFILLGYFVKRRFREEIDEKSLVLVSIYVLQPILIFWGFTHRKIDLGVVSAPAIFVATVLLLTLMVIPLARLFFEDQKERSVAIATSIVGNTGNLGIPLGIALFGEGSVIYTSIINLANIFLVYTIGVFFYSRGAFSVKESLKNIFRLPAIWFGFFAIGFNLSHLSLPTELEEPVQMGAFATMVIQLLIFGIYLEGVRPAHISRRLFLFVGSIKFLLIPLLGIGILSLFALEPMVRGVILLELIVPIAVMNVNLAALYDCKPSEVAFLTFATSIFFLFYLPIVVSILR